ncbi:MAG: hypothetical protein C4527_19100 [Candidatus Omnitrophota bacterium]|nr:MAG: hypothetical protein C4527_19100 [Candidatus Omnitrophota bacterium]
MGLISSAKSVKAQKISIRSGNVKLRNQRVFDSMLSSLRSWEIFVVILWLYFRFSVTVTIGKQNSNDPNRFVIKNEKRSWLYCNSFQRKQEEWIEFEPTN